MGASWLQVALGIVAVAMAIWILGPVVAFFLGRQRFDVDVYAEPPLARPYPEDEDGSRAYRAFVDLGFQPVGWTSEHARFFSPLHWRWRSVQGARWLASPDGRTFVDLYRVVEDEPVRMAATTLFEGGGSWSTHYPGSGLETPPIGNHGRVEVRGVGPAALLEKHAEHVESFRRERGLVIKAATLAEVAAASLEHSRAQLAKMKLGGVAGLPLVGFALPSVLMLAAPTHGDRARLFSLAGVLFMGLVYAAMRHGMLKLTMAYGARRTHTRAFDLEQTAVAPDGTIVQGRYERWVRAIAVVALVDVASWSVGLTLKFSKVLARGAEAMLFGAVFVAVSVLLGSWLVRRVQGRAPRAPRQGRPDLSSLWFQWVVLSEVVGARAFSFSPSVEIIKVLLVGGLSVLAWQLEKRGRT
jgi:hypothetical protein